MKNKMLAGELAAAIRACKARIATYAGTNPQVVQMRERNTGYLHALEDCQSALAGDFVPIRILSGK